MFERFSRNARVAVVLAQEDARELDADQIRPEHLLVGVLQSAGRDLSAVLAGYGITVEGIRRRLAGDPAREPFDEDADALRALGIDLHEVREHVDRTFGPGAFDAAPRPASRRRQRRGHIPFAKASKKTLELALREALAHKHNWIGCEHILLAVLRCRDTEAARLLGEYVDAAELRRGIDALFDAAA